MRFLEQRAANVLMLITVAILAWLSMHLIERWSSTIHYPYQIDASEGFILEQATSIARGETIYGPVSRAPFLVGNYPPLFQTIYAAVNGSRVSLNSLPIGRRLTIAATLISAILLGVIVGSKTRQIFPALLGPMLLLVSYEVYVWSPYVRVDMPALMFTLGGLCVFVMVNRRWGLVVSGLLFTAAIYTRQTAILAPLACAIGLAVNDWRKLPWFIGPMVGSAILVLGFLEWPSGGEFLRHTVAYNANQMDWGSWRLLMKNEVWFFYAWLIVAMVVGVGARIVFFNHGRHGIHGKEHADYVLGIYAVLGAVSLVSYAKVGAAVNYVIEPLAATVLWLCVSIGIMMRSELRIARWVSVVICALVLVHSGWLVHRSYELFSMPNPTRTDRVLAGELVQYLRGVDGDLLCEEPVYTMLAGRPVLFDPFIMSQLAKEAKWDQTTFIHWLEKGRFARIVTTEDLMQPKPNYERYTEAMAEAVRRHYRRAQDLVLPGIGRQYFIYEPAPATK